MKKIFICALGLALASCAGNRAADGDFRVELIRKEPGKALLEITRRERMMVNGLDGYAVIHNVNYWASLAGNGPTFVDPKFSDNPAEYHCKGSITLDTEHGIVDIEMQRIVSKPGESEETKPHPANGVHRIDKIKRASPGDWWF